MSGLISYVKKAFKNYPDTTTPINAANLNHLDDGIYELDQAVATALGSTDISSIGNGTVKGAISNIDGRITTINNNLSDLREEMKKMGLPILDFANPIKQFVNNDSYTAQDGDYLFIGSLYPNNGASTEVHVDGKTVAQSNYNFNLGLCTQPSGITIRLGSGQIVTTDNNYAVPNPVFILRELTTNTP